MSLTGDIDSFCTLIRAFLCRLFALALYECKVQVERNRTVCGRTILAVALHGYDTLDEATFTPLFSISNATLLLCPWKIS